MSQPLVEPAQHRIALPPGEAFDSAHTFTCGQVFGWREVGGWWYGPYGRGALSLRVEEESVVVRSLGPGLEPPEIRRFLGLDVSLRRLYEQFSSDPVLARAAAAAPGLRLLRQDPWLCTASFICSSWNNIPKIELSMQRISAASGRLICWPEGVETPIFPRPEDLAEAQGERLLRDSALGYRAAYLMAAARMIAAGELDPAGLRGKPYEEALREILRLPGVGRKVADCILLFSLDQPEAFPVDVWVRRALHDFYPAELREALGALSGRRDAALTAPEHRALVDFARRRWPGYAGYAQQYLFYGRRRDGRAGNPGAPGG